MKDDAIITLKEDNAQYQPLARIAGIVMLLSIYLTVEIHVAFVLMTLVASFATGTLAHALLVDEVHKNTKHKLAESQGKLKALSDLPGAQAEIMGTPLMVFTPDYGRVHFRHIEDCTYLQVDVDNETVGIFTPNEPKIDAMYTTSDVGEC